MQGSAVQALRALGAALRSSGASCSEAVAFSGQRWFSAAQTAQQRSGGNVPEGHRNSDLNPTVCHIGLGRRRDLTMRQDLCLYTHGGAKKTLAEIFRVSVAGLAQGACAQWHVGLV